ncbi:hypothetical protein SAMN05421538_10977 [Paracoccus isoporae]|uniref:Ig-like domain-containing protein n=1 Tax=Paracoccus isoporae TaxID=591205 RepID=A0A1G7ETX5_9RHOB|nr:hypothetical protein [Paracoccus isoporae]SDE67143.1 hypothetical protein SAMN05421538_10977 [Paracoccus isoporae]
MARTATLLSLALLAALPAAQAAGFTAKNGMVAAQTGPTEISVAYAPLHDATDYWCAAGDFARRALGLPGKTRIWRASPEPRGAGQGITFTLNPDLKAEGTGPSHFGAGPDDGSVSLAMASVNYCRPALLIWRD